MPPYGHKKSKLERGAMILFIASILLLLVGAAAGVMIYQGNGAIFKNLRSNSSSPLNLSPQK